MRIFEMSPMEVEQIELLAELKDGLSRAEEAKQYYRGLINALPEKTSAEQQSSREYSEVLVGAKQAGMEVRQLEDTLKAYHRWLGGV